MGRPGSRAGWHRRAPASAPVTLTTTTASASVPRCCREVSRGWDTHIAPMGANLGCHPAPLLPPGRLVVRRLWSLQPERHLLPSTAQHPQAQRHPLAPLPGAQLLPERHSHDDTTCQLLACQCSGQHRHSCQPGTEGGLWERGQLGDTEPSWPLQGSFSPSYIFHSCLSCIPGTRALQRGTMALQPCWRDPQVVTRGSVGAGGRALLRT